jgi:hypothetical protein
LKGDKGDAGDQGPQGIQGIQGIQGDSGVAVVNSSGIGSLTYDVGTSTLTYAGPSGSEVVSLLAKGSLWAASAGHLEESDTFDHHFGLWALHRTTGDIIFTDVTGHFPDRYWTYVGDGIIEFTGV